MISKRIIPILLLKNEDIVKTVNYKNPKYIGEVKHQYSHFKVNISLFLIHIDSETSLETRQEYKWVTRKKLDSFALPKANYKMLEILDKLN